MLYHLWIDLSVTLLLDVISSITDAFSDTREEKDLKELTLPLVEDLSSFEPPDPTYTAETSFKEKPPLWAIIIGINDYRNTVSIKGAVRDANAMDQYLQTDLKVPKSQIVNLRDAQATRAGIIGAFIALLNNDGINNQDPILIFYAGHAGTLEIGKVQTHVWIPADYEPGEVDPIPQGTIVSLIKKIAKKHGNNITLILDCCFNRTDAWVHSGEATSIPFQKCLDSHVLLAGCSPGEAAREYPKGDGASGYFTRALLELFKAIPPYQMTYIDVISRIHLQIQSQTPRCEGRFKTCYFFSRLLSPPQPRTYEVQKKHRNWVLKGGKAHGIADGAEFTLFRKKLGALGSPLGVMVARQGKVGPFSAFLEESLGTTRTTGLDTSTDIIALQTAGSTSIRLKLHLPSDNQSLAILKVITRVIEHGIGNSVSGFELVDRSEASLQMVPAGEGKVAFDVLERRARDFGLLRIPHVVDCGVNDLRRVLHGVAHYHFHLNHNQDSVRIKEDVTIDFFPLKAKYDEHGDLFYVPGRRPMQKYDQYGDLVVPGGRIMHEGKDNLHKSGKIDIDVYGSEVVAYGMDITNKTPFDLHVQCFFFNHSDFSITALTDTQLQAHTRESYPLPKRGGTAEVGYGSGLGIPPFRCNVPDGQDLTVGFLKFYLTSESVDLSHVPRPSPFFTSRGMVYVGLEPEVFHTILIPVIQRRVE